MPTNFDETTVFKAKGVKITSNTSHLTLVIKSIKGMKVWVFFGGEWGRGE